MTFIVRASVDAQGVLSGVVVAARSGRKEQFSGPDQLASVIAAMAERNNPLDDSLARLERGAP